MEPFDKNLTRRDFLIRSAAAAAAALSGSLPGCSKDEDNSTAPNGETNPSGIPRRPLGKTNLPVSILSFGGGSYFLHNVDGAWEPMLVEAMESGINLFDTCSCYRLAGTKTSEERFGLILSPRRRQLIISTKFDSRSYDGAAAEFEQSLNRLQTDYVDILLIHSIVSTDDLRTLEQGAYRRLVRLKEEGAAKYIGFSSMSSSERSKELLENLDFDVVMLALSPTRYGDYAGTVLPVARAKNVGVIAMKTMQGLVAEFATAQELLDIAWAREGVSSVVVGHYTIDALRENIALAKDFSGIGPARANRLALERRLAPLAGPRTLSWARPGYRDCGG
jgi:predicted aldo/keto reductase-like oxidoreductase